MEESDNKLKPTVRIPKKLGACADILYDTRNTRLGMGRAIKQLQVNETALKDYMLKTFTKEELTSARGNAAAVSIDYENYPSLKDPTKFFQWVAKNKRWDMLYKQVNADAWREMHNAGKKVPGVEPFRDVKFSVTRIAAPKRARLADKTVTRK